MYAIFRPSTLRSYLSGDGDFFHDAHIPWMALLLTIIIEGGEPMTYKPLFLGMYHLFEEVF